MPLTFDRSFKGAPGEAVRLSPLVTRVLAPNPGPFTFHGTNTYIVGEDTLAVIDPGPADERHLAAVMAAISGRPVGAIVLTHTHRDHSPGAAPLKALTGAPTYGEGPHRASRPSLAGELDPTEAGGDPDFVPDVTLADGDAVVGPGWQLTVVATPGHTANHLAFALEEEETLFCGDHVMAWSTSIVAPPDGSMTAYMASLDRLMARWDVALYPGHGEVVRDVAERLEGLREHRLERERQVLDRLASGPATIPDLVAAIYVGLDPSLARAAGLSTFATLEWAVERGGVVTDGPPMLSGIYRLA